MADVGRILNAYIQEFGEESVSAEFPKIMEEGIKNLRNGEGKPIITVPVTFVESSEQIKIMATPGAYYIKKIEYDKGIDKQISL